MFSKKQCEIARAFTQSNATDSQINLEYWRLNDSQKKASCKKLSAKLIELNIPIDKGWPLLKNDFESIAKELDIDPTTLFCVFMDWQSKNN